jgi:hypothetical protein
MRPSTLLTLALVLSPACLNAQNPPPPAITGVPLDQADEVEKYPQCIPNAQSGYHGNKCLVQIWRTNPISPPAFTVPAGIDVYVELLDTRWNENVTFTVTTTKVPPPDVGAAALKNAIPGLQTIIATQALNPTAHTSIRSDTPDPGLIAARELAAHIDARQREIINSSNAVLTDVQHATAAINCLSSYEVIKTVEQPPGSTEQPKFRCSQAEMLTPSTFDAAKGEAVTLAQSAAEGNLALLDVSDLDQVVKSFYLTCLTYFPISEQGGEARTTCRKVAVKLSNQEASIDTAVTDIQKVQDALLQTTQTIQFWPGTPPKLIYKITSQKHLNFSVVIAGTEIVSKANSPIATVTINTAANSWVASVGLGFSNLKYHTFAATPIIVAGQPVLDSSGKVTTQVTRTDTVPSVIAPVGLLSYRLTKFSRFNWENKCPGGCSFLLSGGVGANLTTKSADFDVGPSFQIGGVVITGAVHFGRDTRLTNGVAVGQQLGSSPPSSLPTTTAWVTKYAITFTYSIPIP